MSIGISPSHASLIAARKRRPSLKLALKIEAELGIPVTHWAGAGDEPELTPAAEAAA